MAKKSKKQVDPMDAVHKLLYTVMAAPSECLEMSLMHCHAKNVSSIVVAKDSFGSLSRIFLAWPGHELHENRLGRSLPVGIHNHKYNLSLAPIYGEVYHTIYMKDDEGVELQHYVWENRAGRHMGTVRLKEMQRGKIDHETLMSIQLHNIDCEGCAAWSVIEGRKLRLCNDLYTAREPSVEGLYVPIGSRNDVVQHVNEFIVTCSIWQDKKDAAANGSMA